MKRIALALASAGLLAASGSLALAAPDAAASSGTSGLRNAASGSTRPQGVEGRHMAAARPDADTPDAQRITKALNTLEATGYGDFTNFQAAGKDFTATVTKDGRQLQVVVDPDTGQVNPRG